MTSKPRTWFITGVSSGFGRALAEAVLARGDRVIGTVRQAPQVVEFMTLATGRSFGVRLDMTDSAAVTREISGAIERAGGIDVLVNNAGYGMTGAVEEVSQDEARHMMETNFFGTLAAIQAALPFMRAQGHGHILNFSSLAGIQGIPGMALYNASKFAVEGLSEGLAAELKGMGIKVTIVAPGSFRTAFAGRSVVRAGREIAAYAGTAGQVRHGIAHIDGTQAGDPAKAAQVLIDLVDAPKPPLRLALGADSVATVRHKLHKLETELTAWEAVSNSTAFD